MSRGNTFGPAEITRSTVVKLLFFENAYDPGSTAGTVWNWLQIR